MEANYDALYHNFLSKLKVSKHCFNHFEIRQSLHSLQLTINIEMLKVVNKSFDYCRRTT